VVEEAVSIHLSSLPVQRYLLSVLEAEREEPDWLQVAAVVEPAQSVVGTAAAALC